MLGKTLAEKAWLAAAVLAAVITMAPGAEAKKGIPAFPGAEGYGVNGITGGRGGVVRKVTNLNDAGPGSFREAAAGDEPKIVVFAVGGIIRNSGVRIGSNTTVAGQTSPSGITFYNWDRPLPKNNRVDRSVKNGSLGVGDNVIIRHIRARGSAYKSKCLAGYAKNVILDHCSFSWSGDEIVTFWSGSRNITIQWCTLEESVGFWHGEGGHNYGPMIGSKPGCGKLSGDYSVHHTLIAHHKKRGPELQLGPTLSADVRNCVWYDAGAASIVTSRKGPWGGTVSVVNNYARPGPSTGGGVLGVHLAKKWQDELKAKGTPVRAYYKGNYSEKVKGQPKATSWVHPRAGLAVLPVWLDKDPGPKITTHSAKEAYKLVLAKAGAWPRDATTRRTIQEVKDGTGGWVMMPKECMTPAQSRSSWVAKQHPKPYVRIYKDDPNDWPELPAPKDSDNDGMPDAWEKAKGLKPDKDDHNGKSLSNVGYTNIEVYINERAEAIVGKDIPKSK